MPGIVNPQPERATTLTAAVVGIAEFWSLSTAIPARHAVPLWPSHSASK